MDSKFSFVLQILVVMFSCAESNYCEDDQELQGAHVAIVQGNPTCSMCDNGGMHTVDGDKVECLHGEVAPTPGWLTNGKTSGCCKQCESKATIASDGWCYTTYSEYNPRRVYLPSVTTNGRKSGCCDKCSSGASVGHEEPLQCEDSQGSLKFGVTRAGRGPGQCCEACDPNCDSCDDAGPGKCDDGYCHYGWVMTKSSTCEECPSGVVVSSDESGHAACWSVDIDDWHRSFLVDIVDGYTSATKPAEVGKCCVACAKNCYACDKAGSGLCDVCADGFDVIADKTCQPKVLTSSSTTWSILPSTALWAAAAAAGMAASSW